MKPNYTHLAVILDRSGSMTAIKEDTEGGFNTFIEEQKKVDGTATVSLTVFDTKIDQIHSFVDIQEFPKFTLIPRGYTALLDAVGLTIVSLGEKLSSMKEEDRPEKVVVVIITDGEENSSREYTYEKIAAMIQEQTDTWKWEFVFLGANQDAIAAGAKLNIRASNSMSYAANSKGVGSTYTSLGTNLRAMRSHSAETMAFTNADRDAQADAGVK